MVRRGNWFDSYTFRTNDDTIFDAIMPKRLKPKKLKPSAPKKDVVEKQDPKHTQADFLRDLDLGSTDKAKELMADPSGPDRGSSRT